MSYAILRNSKLTRNKVIITYIHNERKSNNHSNLNIDTNKSNLNYHIKKCNTSYVKEFDNLKLKGQIRSNSIILCEYLFTSDKKFFSKLTEKETKRYFTECYNFVANYKNLGNENIVSAVVHLDEETPHMHLVFAPVIHIKDKDNIDIDKLSCRDFFRGRNSYKILQDEFFKHIKSAGFNLERGKDVEETNVNHIPINEFKKLTNFDKTKEVVKNAKLNLPVVPDLDDIPKLNLKRDDKIQKEIITPKDKLINELYEDNISLHKELNKQAILVDNASKYYNNADKIVKENNELKQDILDLEKTLKDKDYEIDIKLRKQEYILKRKYNSTIKTLEKQVSYLVNKINTLTSIFKEFSLWVIDKFNIRPKNDIIENFKDDRYINIDLDKKIDLYSFKRDFQQDNENEDELEM